MNVPNSLQSVAAEFLGTAGLLAVVVGSGIMGETLAGGNVAVALLANSLATGAALVALILTFGPISGAHFNPAVTFVEWTLGRVSGSTLAAYVPAQIAGAVLGVLAAHFMFELDLVQASTHVRSGASQIFSEAVATFGLIAVILSTSRTQPAATPFAVALYIVAAYWFTSSTSFANPAVTIARSLTDTFAGIRMADVPGFIFGQLAGAVAASALFGKRQVSA